MRCRTPLRWRSVLLAGVTVVAVTAAPIFSASPASRALMARADTVRISDGAIARVPDRVQAGGKVRITGRNWTLPAAAGSGGSAVLVEFDEGAVKATRPVTNPITGDPIRDPTVIAAFRAKSRGTFAISIPIPETSAWAAGTHHTVRLLSGDLLSDDATRSIALSFDVVDSVPSSPPSAPPSSLASPVASNSAIVPAKDRESAKDKEPAKDGEPAKDSEPAGSPRPTESSSAPSARTSESSPASVDNNRGTPTPTPGGDQSTQPRTGPVDRSKSLSAEAQRAAESEAKQASESDQSGCGVEPVVTITSDTTIRQLPVVAPGGTLSVSGAGFCDSLGGGATVEIEIDNGKFVRADREAGDSGPAVWQTVAADAEGGFATTLRLPMPGESLPSLTDGLHRLRLSTVPSSAAETTQSVHSGEFVLSSGYHPDVLPEPTSAPKPVKPAVALVGSRAGAVTAIRSGSMMRVVVPNLEPGDWVFPYVFNQAKTNQGKPVSWQQLDTDRSIVVDTDDAIDDARGAMKVSLQARDGTLVGWALVVPASSTSDGPPLASTVYSESTSQPAIAKPEPRPLVVFVGGAVLTVGLLSLVAERRRRRRLIRELNGF